MLYRAPHAHVHVGSLTHPHPTFASHLCRRNAILHYLLLPGGGPDLAVHCLDEETSAMCLQHAHEKRLRCVRAPALSISHHGRAEAILMYKLQAARREAQQAEASGRSILVLDVDALVLSRACFDEWFSYPEAIIAQAGGCPGCTDRICHSLHAVFNTGVLLIRPAAFGFLDRMVTLWEARRGEHRLYRHHCFEQEWFNDRVAAAQPRWLEFPRRVALQREPTHHTSAALPRALARWREAQGAHVPLQWHGDLAASGRHPAGDPNWRHSTCVLHLISEGRRANVTFAKYGLWHSAVSGNH